MVWSSLFHVIFSPLFVVLNILAARKLLFETYSFFSSHGIIFIIEVCFRLQESYSMLDLEIKMHKEPVSRRRMQAKTLVKGSGFPCFLKSMHFRRRNYCIQNKKVHRREFPISEVYFYGYLSFPLGVNKYFRFNSSSLKCGW